MTAKNIPTSTERRAPLSALFVEEAANYRLHTEDSVSQMCEMLSRDGQRTAILVTEDGPTKEQPYTVRGGRRRVDAMRKLKWKDDVRIVIRSYPKVEDAPVLAQFDTYDDNESGSETSALERGEWIDRMVTGTYWVPAGMTAVPVPEEVIAERLGVSKRYVQQQRKVFTNLDADVAAAIRAIHPPPPQRLLIALGQMQGEGEDKDEKAADKARKQNRELQAWMKKQEDLEAAGRRRAERSDAGTSRGGGEGEGGEAKPLVPETKKLDREKGRTVADYLRAIEKREEMVAKEIETARSDKARLAAQLEQARIEGIHEATLYFTGERKKFPMITENEFKAVARDDAEAAKAAEAKAEKAAAKNDD